jgi:CHAD domain-containing protein/uncharacterized protein YjbK
MKPPELSKTEIEVKYLVGHGRSGKQVQKKLARQFGKFGFTVHGLQTLHFADTYYDTSKHDLENAGWSLRIRSTAGSQIVTMKSATQASAPFTRTEIEHTYDNLNSSNPGSISFSPDSDISALLQSLEIPPASLLPVYQQQTQRKRFQIRHPSNRCTRIEWAVDTVSSDLLPDNYVEFEFELLDGPENLLQHLNLVAQAQKHLSPSRMSKLQRGLYASCPDRQPGLLQNQSTAHAERRWHTQATMTLQSCLDSLVTCEPFAFEAIHPEGVHQLRIATRRTRAALDLFHDVIPPVSAGKLQSELKYLTRALGKVRDLDVHRAQLTGNLAKKKWRKYEKYLNKQQTRRQRQLQCVLTEHFVKIRSHLNDIIQQTNCDEVNSSHTVGQHLAQILPPSINRILEAGANLSTHASADEIHALRIALKKLRYQLETFSDISTDLYQLTNIARDLQSLLGDHQDNQLARSMVEKFTSTDAGLLFSGLDRFYKNQNKQAKKARVKLARTWCDFALHCQPFQVSPHAAT